MKKFLLFAFFIAILNFNVALAIENEVAISLTHSSEEVQLIINTNGVTLLDWGDGTVENIGTYDGSRAYRHTYASSGTYNVTIKDDVVGAFQCGGNEVTELNIINCKALGYLDCAANELKSLDLSQNKLLYFLNCSLNQISELNLNNNTKLESIYCFENKITGLDLSKNIELRELECDDNQLSNLNLYNNIKIKEISCDNNQISHLDLSNNLELESLSCSNNQITSLSPNQNPKLDWLMCDNNNMLELDISQNSLLKYGEFKQRDDNFILTLTLVQNKNIEFEDVKKRIVPLSDTTGTKYEDAVTHLIENDIISGYPDNTFKPEKTITRAEISTVITKFNKINILENATLKFIDITTHWGKYYINTLATLGFVAGYENNEFRPDNEVTYAEVTAMVLNSLGYKNEISKMSIGWPNNYINKATDMGLYKNLDASNPNKKMTRGDVAIFVYNVTKKFNRIELRNDDQTIEMPNLVGMSLQEAKDLLEENNILITNVIEKHNDIYDIGIVSQQLPSPGINIKTGVKTVYLTVSIGKAEIRVPNIIFSTLDVAKKTLEDNNINYIVIDEFHEVIPAGYVINTKPFVDELISTDRIIDVYVSAGPQK